MKMKISENGIALIKKFESCKLTAYKATSTEKYYTIGWGHYGSDVTKGMKITQAQADAYLVSDLAKFETKVNKYQAKYNFNQNQYDALMSFAYNIGSIDGLTANGTRTIAQISAKFGSYNTQKGKVLAGLTKRRAAEKKLFNTAVKNNFTFDGVDYSKVFDPVWYADHNPDVVAAVGNTPAKLFEHFIAFGRNEASRAGKTISDFNITVYLSHSPDVAADKEYGSLAGGYKHYCLCGYKEDRRTV